MKTENKNLIIEWGANKAKKKTNKKTKQKKPQQYKTTTKINPSSDKL